MILHSLWAARPIGGGMQHINLGWFCQFGIALNDIANGGGLKNWQVAVQSLPKARQMLVYMGDERLLAFSLYASRQLVWNVIRQIDDYMGEDEAVQKLRFDQFKGHISGLMNKLLVQLDGDLSSQPIFLVEPKRSHDIRILLNDGTRMFSDFVRDGADDEERFNMQQAAKCLLFAVPTAAAFHLFRAAEGFLRRYYQLIVGSLPKKVNRNWGSYLRVLKTFDKSDKRILMLMGEVKDLYRNPIIHPETSLDMDDVLSLVGLLDSLMTLIAGEILAHTPAKDPGEEPKPTFEEVNISEG